MTKNIHTQIQKNSRIYRGYSDKRVHFCTTACLLTILFAAPSVGFATTSLFVVFFALIGMVIAAKFQSKHKRSQLLFECAMDEIYYNAKNAKYYDKMLDRYKSRSQIRRLKKAQVFANASVAQHVIAKQCSASA